jgi:sporulation protein YlmC with PRC-barrel domain
MYLVRQVLDKQLVDENGSKAGKVDDLLIELRDDGPPQVVAILTGPNTVAVLLPAWLQRLTSWIRTAVLGLEQTKPMEVDWSHVTHIDVVVHLDVNRLKAGLVGSQESIWKRWLKPLPFSER